MDDIIYLDHHATTPTDPRVVDAMLPYFTQAYGNPASVDHAYGQAAAKAVEKAREQLASLISSRPEEVIFTSGATESDNLALRGVMAKAGAGSHLITTQVEHKAVLETCEALEAQGHEVTYLGVDAQARIDLRELKAAIRDDTALISVMAANNEVGTIYPLAEIGAIAKEHGVLFHTDAAQAVGHVPIDVQEMGIDLMSMSAHKMYGPKGVGALYVRRRAPRVELVPTQTGGGHERGLRSGTHNVPAIVGMGIAAELARVRMASDAQHVAALRNRLQELLAEAYPKSVLIGPAPDEARLPHNLLLSFPPLEARALLRLLAKHVAVSAGSACQADTVEKSHVLEAMRIPDEVAFGSLRFGLGRSNTLEEVVQTASAVATAVARIRAVTA